jgi:hypothetical protein
MSKLKIIRKKLIDHAKNNDYDTLYNIIENDDDILTNELCSVILITSLINNNFKIAKYISSYGFDLNPEIYDEYKKQNKLSDKHIIFWRNFFKNHMICCLIN